MTNETTTRADSRDMYAVHNMLRQGFGQLPGLVRGVTANAERAELVADHARLLVTIVTTHHEAEDAILWPALTQRAPDELAPVVDSMERQHRELHSLLNSVEESAVRYRMARGSVERDALARTAEGVLGPLHEHLAAEEREILPLIDRYLTNAEWAAVGEHGLPHLTPTQVPLVFGMMLREATEDQRALLAKNVPHDVFAQMAQVAPPALAAYERELYGKDTADQPPAGGGSSSSTGTS
jgi:hemerythrin-like domain-containing protein